MGLGGPPPNVIIICVKNTGYKLAKTVFVSRHRTLGASRLHTPAWKENNNGTKNGVKPLTCYCDCDILNTSEVYNET